MVESERSVLSFGLFLFFIFFLCFAFRNWRLLNSLVYIFTEWAENLLMYSFLLRNSDLMELKYAVGMVGGLPSCFALLLAAGHLVCSPSCLSCGPAALSVVAYFKYLYILTNKTANHQLEHQLVITTKPTTVLIEKSFSVIIDWYLTSNH